jgi:hypothetical protein
MMLSSDDAVVIFVCFLLTAVAFLLLMALALTSRLVLVECDMRTKEVNDSAGKAGNLLAEDELNHLLYPYY